MPACLPLSVCLAGNNRVNEFVRNRCVIPFSRLFRALSLAKVSPNLFLSLFSCYLSLSPSIFVRPQDAIVCAAFAVASQKLKSKTVYGEAVYGFGYFMQISSITFQSIRQTVAEGSLHRIRGWWEGVTSFVRSTGSSSIFVHSTFNLFSQSPDPPNFPSPIELFTLLPPVTICNTHRGWRTTGLVQFSVLVMVTPCPVDWLSVGRSACPSVCHSLNRNETRRVASNEFALCLPKGFSIESVKYHNLQSNPKSSTAHFSFLHVVRRRRR